VPTSAESPKRPRRRKRTIRFLKLTSVLVVGILTVSASVGVSLGSLELRTEPGTSILWNDVLLGSTDEAGSMTISNIPLGVYSIIFRNEGFETATRDLDIVSGSQTVAVPLVAKVGEGLAPSLDPELPDPFARPSTSLVSVAVVGFLAAIAVGALWLGRRQRPEPEEEVPSPPSGPRVVMADGPKGRRRPPRFYEDLRHRETVLENLGERGPDRPRPKIIELPVVDHRSPEGDG